jgi:Phage integrase family.
MSNNIAGVTDFFSSVTISKSAPTKERRALTESEQQWIIDTEHRAQLPAMIMLFSGLRRGEVIPLMWSDVDLKRGFISVNKSVEFTTNQPNIKKAVKVQAL